MHTPTTPARRATDSYRHGNLRNAALDAAAALVAERGGPDFSLREIAESLGVRHAALYRHFASREALVSGLATRAFETMQQRFEAATAEAGGNVPALLAGLRAAYLAMAREEPGAYRVMFSNISLPDPARTAAAEGCFGRLVGAFARAQAEGLARGDVPAIRLAAVNWAALHGMSMLLLDQRLEDNGAAGGPAALLETLGTVLEQGWAAMPRP